MQRIGILRRFQFFDQVHRTVGGDDIEPAIVVIVEEHGAEAREGNARRRDAHFDAAILEIPLAPIEEQRAFLAG